jgi:opacity protein-like surface antigen
VNGKATILLALSAFALLGSPVMAADLGLFGAYWDTKDADRALGGGAKVGFGRYFELRATYFSDVTADTEPERHDFEVSAVPLEAGLRYGFDANERFQPYVAAGATYIMLDTTRGDIDDETGWYAALGADIETGERLGFMAEVIYRGVETTVAEDDPFDGIRDEVTIDLGGLGVNAGVVWSW